MAEAPGEVAAKNVLINACQKRADKTLHDRANSLFMCIRYMKSVDTPSFPLSVDTVDNFVESCRIEGAAASRAASVKKALKPPRGFWASITTFGLLTLKPSTVPWQDK